MKMNLKTKTLKMIGKENIYVVETTTGDKWEIATGILLVKSKTKTKARKIAQEHLNRSASHTEIIDVDKIEDYFKAKMCDKILDGKLFEFQSPIVE